MRLLAAAALLAFAALGHAQTQKMYKCVDAKGQTRYTAEPGRDCPGGSKEIKAPPPGSGKAPPTLASKSAPPPPKAYRAPTRTPAEQDKWDADATERRATQKDRPR